MIITMTIVPAPCPQTLDTTALVITLANTALQLLAMVWLLMQTVKVRHIRALISAPRKAARSMTKLVRSATTRRRRPQAGPEAMAALEAAVDVLPGK
jgi:hypothetical protein